MSSTSRRTFLSGAAALAAGYAVTSGRVVPNIAEARANTDIDAVVAFDFVEFPRFVDPVVKGYPSAAALLYGLVCADVRGQELLMPSTTGLMKADGSGVHLHRARLWVLDSSVPTGTAVDGSESRSGVSLSYWTIDGFAVSVSPLDSTGTIIVDQEDELEEKESDTHPWTRLKWMRRLKAHTGLKLLKVADRNNLALITSRIALQGGQVVALPPFSKDGQNGEWRVKKLNGDTYVSATTDSMLWKRPFPQGTTSVKFTLTPIGGGTAREIVVKLTDDQLLAVVTNATTSAHSDPTKLEDSTAYARLLRKGDPATFPVPEAIRPVKAQPGLSSEDVHCECAAP